MGLAMPNPSRLRPNDGFREAEPSYVSISVIPAKAGTHFDVSSLLVVERATTNSNSNSNSKIKVGSSFRWNDDEVEYAFAPE